jgi:hypothetical protein
MSVMAMAHRIGRIQSRNGHMQRAKMPAAYPRTGVLEFDAIVIVVQAMIPKVAIPRCFLELDHNPTNIGSKTVAKVPANIG